jgi:hypothetical protein
MKAHVEDAIKRAALIAARSGVASAPLHRAEQILWQRFEGNIFQIQEIIAYYDEHDDEIIFNPTHFAWGDMNQFVRSMAKKNFYSTASPDHVIRHEIGHCLHYRRMSDAERAEIWYGELSRHEKTLAAKISGYATVGRVEFVAEVFAQICARRQIQRPIMSLYAKLRGPSR